MVNNIEAEIRSRVDAFVAELTELVRRAALEAVSSVLNEQMGGAPRRLGRAAGAAPAKAAPAQAPRAAASKRGEKRSQEELTALRERVLEHIRANNGQGVEQISKALGTSTRELSLPIRRLLTDKQISSKGEKRATRYFAR